MSCISEDIIQKYIDRETSAGEAAEIVRHAETCEMCSQRIENQKKMAASLKNAINLLAENTDEIPVFVNKASQIKKPFVSARKLVYALAAACILALLFFVFQEKDPGNQSQFMMVNMAGDNVDANRPIDDQPLIIHVIDKEGNVSSFSIN
jgi:hypothetical protein